MRAPDFERRLARLGAAPRDRKRLVTLLAFAESLPETVLKPFGERHVALAVRRKTFAYYTNDHHGDGRIAVCCKSTPVRQRERVAAAPQRFYVPPYLGTSGWVALRLDGPRVDWSEVYELVVEAYRLQAPRKLAAELE